MSLANGLSTFHILASLNAWKKTVFRCYSHLTNKDLFSSSHNLKVEELGFNSRFSDSKVHLLFTEQLVDTAVSILSAFHWNHGSAPAMKVRLCTPGQLGLSWDQKTSFCAEVGGMPSLPLSHVARAPPENRALASVSPSFSRVQAGTRDKSFCLLPLPTSPPDLHDTAEKSVYLLKMWFKMGVHEEWHGACKHCILKHIFFHYFFLFLT